MSGIDLINEAFNLVRLKESVTYEFDISGRMRITILGGDTVRNYDIALKTAIQRAKNEIDSSWLHLNACVSYPLCNSDDIEKEMK